MEVKCYQNEQRLPEHYSERMRFPGSIYIRFRNSGSYQQPFNITFMIMYQKLQEYDPEYYQIHVEEYVYQKKLIKNKASDNNLLYSWYNKDIFFFWEVFNV